MIANGCVRVQAAVTSTRGIAAPLIGQLSKAT